MSAPLVNDYKKNFILKRIFETFLGGLRLYFSSSVPAYVYLIQILLFAFIPITVGIFIHIQNNGTIRTISASLSSGCITLLYSLSVQIVAICLQRQKPVKEMEQVNTFGDEEVYEFDAIFGPKTWLFLFPPKKLLCNVIFHSLLVGALGGLSVYYLHLEPKTFLWNHALRSLFTTLGLFTISVGIWPLIVGSPPELAIFHQLPYDLQDLSRTSHMLTCILIHGIASQYPTITWLYYINCIFHILFALSPFLWLLGALPPIDAYLIWALEQWLVLFLGGSPTASNQKLVFYVLIGTMNLMILSVLPNLIALSIYSSIAGFLLSLDLSSMLAFLRRHRVQNVTSPVSGKPSRFRRIQTISSAAPWNVSRLQTESKCLTKQELYIYGIVLMGIVGFSLALCIPHREWYAQSSGYFDDFDFNTTNETISEDPPPIFQSNTMNILWGCLIFLSVIVLLLHRVQKPYVFIWFKNRYLANLKQSNLKLILMISYLVHCGGPFVSFLFIHILIGANLDSISFEENYEASFCLALSYGFLFRQIWQCPEHNMIILSLFLAIEKIGGEALGNSSWGLLATPNRIHLFSLICLWLRRTFKRLKVIFMFSYTSVSETKQRKLINYFLLGLNLGLAPFLVLICCISSVLSFPLFPLFTLPLFLIGFPRPMRFWSYPIGYSANQCSDTIYYEQILPYVTKALHQRILSNGLGIVNAGEIFLLRWEDRLLWVQVLEVGFSYMTYSFKGLELQETSCHTAEAGRVDSIFSRAFDKTFADNWFNPFPMNTLIPLSKVNALGYSDTRNVLTGVIDSPETLGVIKDYFSKALVYFLINHAHTYNGKRPYSPCNRPPADSRVSNLGSSSTITRKAFSSLPRAERVKSGTSRASVSSHVSNVEENQSIKSQSGRGSRLAWVDDTKVAGIISKMEARATEMHSESISDEENEIPSMRPVSWASNDITVDTRRNSIYDNDELVRGFAPREKSSGGTKTIVLRPVKVKSYVRPASPIDLDKKKNDTDLNDDLSDSDSETDSIRKYHLRNFSRKQNKEDKENLASIIKHSSKSFKQPLKDIGELQKIPGIDRQESNLELKKDLSVKFDPNTKGKTRLLAYKSSLSVTLSPQLNWTVDLPVDEESLEDLQDEFPLSWFKFLLKHFGIIEIEELNPGDQINKLNPHDERLIEQLIADEYLEESYRTLVALCQMTVLGLDMGLPSANQVFKLFYGDFSNSKSIDWLKTKESLMNIVLKSYRIAVKLSLDHSLVAPINNCWTDLENSLAEYNKDWYVGPDTDITTNANTNNDALWDQAIKEEKINLFSLGYNEIKSQYTSHLLSLSDTEINVGKLEDENVRSIWASLTGELLYFTNDDDERYSIQAHTVLLRNLTIQAADPPLGYPIYSSPSISVGLT